MATISFEPGTKVTIDGKEYTLATTTNVENGIEERAVEDGSHRFFNQAGEEVNQDGSPLKAASKTVSKKK